MDARGVAKDVIRRMGLDAAVRAACTDAAGAYTVDVDGDGVEYLFGDRIAEVNQNADGVDVTFASGDRHASSS